MTKDFHKDSTRDLLYALLYVLYDRWKGEFQRKNCFIVKLYQYFTIKPLYFILIYKKM
jgi:hypothetical protein